MRDGGEMSDDEGTEAITSMRPLGQRKMSIEPSVPTLRRPKRSIEKLKMLAARRAQKSALRLAKSSIPSARCAALIVLSCMTLSSEGVYATNNLSVEPAPKLMQTVYANWWARTDPSGEEFGLPSSMKNCSLLKVRPLGPVSWAAARVGPGHPSSVSVLVERDYGDQQYSIGMIIEAFFYIKYDDVLFGASKLNKTMGFNGYWFLDRKNANLAIDFRMNTNRPEDLVYVCVFKEGEQVLLSYFLNRARIHPWSF
jgi:hypothetical protein